jgi:hypothetical protein
MFDANVAAAARAGWVDDSSRFLMWARYCQIHRDPERHDLAVLLAGALGLSELGPGLAPA